MLDELKEIEEIINRLDSINSEDWNRREDETEEEFEEALDLAMEGCMRISKIQEEALKERYNVNG